MAEAAALSRAPTPAAWRAGWKWPAGVLALLTAISLIGLPSALRWNNIQDLGRAVRHPLTVVDGAVGGRTRDGPVECGSTLRLWGEGAPPSTRRRDRVPISSR